LYSRKIDYDCKYYLGDRPCQWHKKEGVLCTCTYYSRIEERILIIKLDATGDVLRTTSILPALSKAHPGASITWITRAEAKPLLEFNPYITEVLVYGPDALSQIHTRQWDRVINLDAGRISSALASMVHSPRKDGFVIDKNGVVQPTNPAARQWLEMGIFDDLKRTGNRSYQNIIMEILGLETGNHQYVFELSPSEMMAGRDHLAGLGVLFDRPIIGLNTGGGGRWPLKQWRAEAYVDLAERLHASSQVQLILLGGPEERQRNAQLKAVIKAPVMDSGCDNSLRHFAAIVNQCSIIVTGDTLAMHIALALGRRVVVLFGPTSAAEIELYGLGEKITPDIPCLGCYRNSCDLKPNCMDIISIDAVFNAVVRQIRETGVLSSGL
jgi:ADP-heptose:LPS heptosyltransferase